MASPNWPDEADVTPSPPRRRSATQRLADDIVVGAATVEANQMHEVQAARQLDAERPVDSGVLGRVPGWVWLGIVPS